VTSTKPLPFRGQIADVIDLIRTDGHRIGAGLFATDSRFIDDLIAAGFDRVSALIQFVDAAMRYLDGDVGHFVVLAGHFVLERRRSLVPIAAEAPFDQRSGLVALNASGRSDLGAIGSDRTFVDDVVFEESIAVLDALALVHASDGLDADRSAAIGIRARVPEIAGDEAFADIVVAAVLVARDRAHAAGAVRGLLALVDETAFGHLGVDIDSSAFVDAARYADVQVVAFLTAGVPVFSIVPLLVGRVFSTFVDARLVGEGQIIVGIYDALHAVRLVAVVSLPYFDSSSVVGHAALGLQFAISALVPVASQVHLCSFRVPAWTSLGGRDHIGVDASFRKWEGCRDQPK